MNHHTFAVSLAALGILLFGSHVRSGAPPPPEELAQKGIEVLTRGPIHEAFAIRVTVDPRPNPIIYQKPPPAIEELPADQKPEGAHVRWIPGYFAWDEAGDHHVWINGLWRATPPGRQWMSGHWVHVRGEADGWRRISGYWAPERQGEIEYLPPAAGFGSRFLVVLSDTTPLKPKKAARAVTDHDSQDQFTRCAKVCAECQQECDACFRHCALFGAE